MVRKAHPISPLDLCPASFQEPACTLAWALQLACPGSRFKGTSELFTLESSPSSHVFVLREPVHKGVGHIRGLPYSESLELSLHFASDQFSDDLENPIIEPHPPPSHPFSPKLRIVIDSFFLEESAEVSGRLRLVVFTPSLPPAHLPGAHQAYAHADSHG